MTRSSFITVSAVPSARTLPASITMTRSQTSATSSTLCSMIRSRVVASRAGKVGFGHGGSYGASKFGLVGLNESLYREFADSPIRVTAICPGWVNTDMAQSPKCPVEPDYMIQVEDIFGTLEWLLSLSPQTCVKEVLIECKGSIA